MQISGKKFATIFSIGSILLILGIFLQWYVPGKITAIEYSLNQGVVAQGISQAALDWWIINQSILFNPISYALITSGSITNIFAISDRAFTIKNNSTPNNKNKTSNSLQSDTDKSIEIIQLKNKIENYKEKVTTQNAQINNLKDNMNLLVNLINEKQEQPIKSR